MQGEMYLKKLEELQKMISGMIADEKGMGEEMPMDMEGEDKEDMPEMAEEMMASEDEAMSEPEMSDEELMEYLKPKEKKKPGKGTIAVAIGLKGKK